MKKAIILGGVLTVAALGGGYYFVQNSQPNELAIYWDGKAELNQKGTDGNLPLIKAVQADDIIAVQTLLAKGADVDIANASGQNAVDVALEKGNGAIFKLVAEKSKADFKDIKFLTKALEGESPDIVEALLKKGADVNAILQFNGRKRAEDVLNYKDPRVITPLKKAVEENKPEMVSVLAKNGAEGVVDFLIEQVRTASLEMVKALGENAGDLRKITAKGTDLLSYSAIEAKPEVLAYLLSKNAGDANKSLNRIIAQRKSDNAYEEAVEMFIKAGAMPSSTVIELMVKKQKTEMFKKLASCYKDPNVKLDNNDEDLFMYATRKGKLDTAEWLLDKGADMWKEYSNGITPLKTSVNFANENPEMLELFEQRLKDVNETGYNGETLLMLFAQNGDFENFERIMNKGGNIWQKDNNGKTVLMYAAEGGNKRIMNYLIFKGDNINAKDNYGRTALMYASKKGQTEIIKLMETKGANVTDSDDDGKTAIMYAAEHGQAEAVAMLINMGESASNADNKGRTVLMYAALGGSKPAVETLLLKGVDVQAIDNDSKSVLMYAVEGKNEEIANRLIRKGANIFSIDKNGYTAEMYALLQGDEKMYNRVKPTITNARIQAQGDGKSLGILAFEGGNIDLVKQTLKQYKQTLNLPDEEGKTFMMMIAGEGRPETVREAIMKQGDIRKADNHGKTVLMYAAEKSVGVNLISILKAITQKKGEDLNLADENGITALMYAVGYKNNQSVKGHMLMTNGADASAKDKNGKTVLMYAVGNPYNKVDIQSVGEIIERAGEVDLSDNDGKTALMYASANKNADVNIIIDLINAGASVNAKDKRGKTVLMYAMESADISKVRVLLAAGANPEGTTEDNKTAKDFINPDLLCFKDVAESVLQKK